MPEVADSEIKSMNKAQMQKALEAIVDEGEGNDAETGSEGPNFAPRNP